MSIRIAIWVLALLLGAAASAEEPTAPRTRDEALGQNIQKMRQILEQEAAQEEQELRAGASSGAVPAGAFATAPVTGGQVRQQLATNLSQVDWDFRCNRVKIKDNQGVVNVVCGENFGAVQGNQANQYGTTVNTTAAPRPAP